ncbi:AAA family ATPase [bacterium]|nr:AAA family ATPase [bacterium]
MRIRHISVKNLFGIFNHEIPLNTGERITIIYGPNGFGKTFTLTLVNELFNPGYEDFYRIPFSDVCVDFDDGGMLGLRKRRNDNGDELFFEFTRPGTKPETFLLDKNPDRHIEEPAWFKELKEIIDVRFIHTERLIQLSDSTHPGNEYTITEYTEELRNLIEKKLAEYAALSQSLDRSFPVRLVTGSNKTGLSLDELKKRFRDIEVKRARLMDAGLLEREETTMGVIDHIDESNMNVLSVYIGDVEKKLSVFKDLTDKIELLMKIVNSRFLQKRMEISRRDGFIFIASDGRKLLPENLSSGEQHVVVLLYELLFKVRPDSLILIDEPELSLHVFWQQQFIRDIQDIIGLAGFDVLIATHSPQIIHDRWDLAVELKGPRE